MKNVNLEFIRKAKKKNPSFYFGHPKSLAALKITFSNFFFSGCEKETRPTSVKNKLTSFIQMTEIPLCSIGPTPFLLWPPAPAILGFLPRLCRPKRFGMEEPRAPTNSFQMPWALFSLYSNIGSLYL